MFESTVNYNECWLLLAVLTLTLKVINTGQSAEGQSGVVSSTLRYCNKVYNFQVKVADILAYLLLLSFCTLEKTSP